MTWFWMNCLVSAMPDRDPFKSILYNEKKKSIHWVAKVFFNNIFCCSIEKLNQRLLSYYVKHNHQVVAFLNTM